MSSFIQVGPKIAHTGREGKDGEHCNVLLHSSTAGREADEHRRVVGSGGGGKVLFHSSGTALCTAALLDERLGSTAGQAAAARSSFVQVGPEIAHAGREGKNGEHCNVLLHSSTAALTAGLEAGEHRCTVGRGGSGKVLFHSSGTALCTAARG